MNNDISVDEFKKALTPQKILGSRIICCALMAGVIIFGVVVSIINTQGSGVEILTPLCLGMAALNFAISSAIPGFYLKLRCASAETMVSRFQGIIVVRLSLTEGAALFGLVSVMVNGNVLNYLAVVPFVITAYLVFPSREKLLRWFIIKVKKDESLLFEHELY